MLIDFFASIISLSYVKTLSISQLIMVSCLLLVKEGCKLASGNCCKHQ